MNQKKFKYTYKTYRYYLDQLLSSEYEFITFGNSIDSGEILLRHDVDWSPQKALKMAKIESDRNISSTYFFLLTSPLYNALFKQERHAIEKIAALGHDVGLHFSTHQYWSTEPDQDELEATVSEELSVLTSVIDSISPAVAFHIPPEWVLDRTFDTFVNTYGPDVFGEIPYIADSSYRWRTEPPFEDQLPKKAQLLVHPGLWGEIDASFEARLSDARTTQFGNIRAFLDDQFLESS